MITRIVAVLMLLTAPVLAIAQDSQLRLPSFDHLKGKAIECVDITIGRWPLKLAAAIVGHDDSDEGVALKEVLRGLKAVYVRSYKFNSDNVYSRRDIELVREQLRTAHWTQLAQVRSSHSGSDVDVYVSLENDEPTGLAIVATEPREFTILNVVGKIDLKNLGKLERHLGLPSLASNSSDAD